MIKMLALFAFAVLVGGGAYVAATDSSMWTGLMQSAPGEAATVPETGEAWEVEYVDSSGAKVDPGSHGPTWLDRMGIGESAQRPALSLPKSRYATTRSAPARCQNQTLSKPSGG